MGTSLLTMVFFSKSNEALISLKNSSMSPNSTIPCHRSLSSIERKSYTEFVILIIKKKLRSHHQFRAKYIFDKKKMPKFFPIFFAYEYLIKFLYWKITFRNHLKKKVSEALWFKVIKMGCNGPLLFPYFLQIQVHYLHVNETAYSIKPSIMSSLHSC